MKKLHKTIILFLCSWGVIFAISFITGNDDLELGKRLFYTFIFAVILCLALPLYIGGKNSNSNTNAKTKANTNIRTNHSNTYKKANTTYVFDGAFGRTMAFRVENNKIYRGTSTRYDYEIRGNKIYKAFSGQSIGRIDGNRIYDNFSSKVLYKMVSNKIYEGEFGNKVIYRITNSPCGD